MYSNFSTEELNDDFHSVPRSFFVYRPIREHFSKDNANMPTSLLVNADDDDDSKEGDCGVTEGSLLESSSGGVPGVLKGGSGCSDSDESYVDDENNGIDYEPDETNNENEESVVVLPPIKSMWECDMIKKYQDDGLLLWKCLWCQMEFKGWNHTKVVDHIAKRRGFDVKPCTRKTIPVEYKNRYRPFVLRRLEKSHESRKKEKKKTAADASKRAHSRKTDISSNKSSAKPVSLSSSKKLSASPSTTRTFESLSTNSYVQTKIGDQRNQETELLLSRAIADMIHSLGLPFSFVSEFKL